MLQTRGSKEEEREEEVEEEEQLQLEEVLLNVVHVYSYKMISLSSVPLQYLS